MNTHSMPPVGSININLRGLFAAKKNGRPPVADPNSERSRRPWISEGISQRTYYRRKAALAATAPAPPPQHAAHVADWFATLGSIARLEHRAFVRRCFRANARLISPE